MITRQFDLLRSLNTRSWRPCKKIIPVGLIWGNTVSKMDSVLKVKIFFSMILCSIKAYIPISENLKKIIRIVFFLLLFFKKEMEILLHFSSFLFSGKARDILLWQSRFAVLTRIIHSIIQKPQFWSQLQ